MTTQPASDRSLLVSFGDEISIEAHHQVAHFTHALEGQRAVLNLHPAFASVLIDFDPRFHSHADIEALVRQRIQTDLLHFATQTRRNLLIPQEAMLARAKS